MEHGDSSNLACLAFTPRDGGLPSHDSVPDQSYPPQSGDEMEFQQVGVKEPFEMHKFHKKFTGISQKTVQFSDKIEKTPLFQAGHNSEDREALGFLLPFPIGGDPPPVAISSHLPPQSVVVAELGAWKLPKSSSPPTDKELLEDHLRPQLSRLLKSKRLDKGSFSEAFLDCSRDPVVNGKLPETNPGEMSGMMDRREDGRRETYYLTDHPKLSIGAFVNDDDDDNNDNDVIKTPCGIWKPTSIGRAVLESDTIADLFSSTISTICGTKKTFVFHSNTGSNNDLTKKKKKKNKATTWIMNVYSCLCDVGISQDELLLCHVFEDDSPASPTCPTSHHACCKGNNCGAAIQAPAKGLLFPTLPVENGLDMHSIPEADRIIIAQYGKKTGTDIGQHDKNAKKRKKSEPSPVWGYFTSILARDPKGNTVKLAACNHCLKVLTAVSTGGTSHLRKHKCPCKLEPVKDGQEYKKAGAGLKLNPPA